MRKIIIALIVLFIPVISYSQQITLKLNEGFESTTFPPTGWKRINVSGANQWQRLTNPYPNIIMQPPVNGIAVARINYENIGGEDWLITRKINSISDGDSLFFYLIKQSEQGPFPPDSMLVKVSTTDSLQASFTNTLININIAGIPTGNQVWHRYSFPLTQFAGQNIFVAFQHKDFNGHGCAIDSVVVFNPGSIGIKQIESTVSDKSFLFQNFPNPFNPSTNINFALQKSGLVTLKVYDILGNEVRTLVNIVMNTGTYSVGFSGSGLPGGVYFYKLESNGITDLKKMVLVK
jgi:hypothetical protein